MSTDIVVQDCPRINDDTRTAAQVFGETPEALRRNYHPEIMVKLAVDKQHFTMTIEPDAVLKDVALQLEDTLRRKLDLRLAERREFASVGTNLVIVLPGKSETTGGMPGFGGVPNDLTLEDAEAVLRGVREVDKAAPLVARIRDAALRPESDPLLR